MNSEQIKSFFKSIVCEAFMKALNNTELNNKYPGFEDMLCALVDKGFVVIPEMHSDIVNHLINTGWVTIVSEHNEGVAVIKLDANRDAFVKSPRFKRLALDMRLEMAQTVTELKEEIESLNRRLQHRQTQLNVMEVIHEYPHFLEQVNL